MKPHPTKKETKVYLRDIVVGMSAGEASNDFFDLLGLDVDSPGRAQPTASIDFGSSDLIGHRLGLALRVAISVKGLECSGLQLYDYCNWFGLILHSLEFTV